MPPPCKHTALNYGSSIHADEVGFRRPTVQQRATGDGKKKLDTDEGFEGTFPAPLVLPGDDLSFDPRCPPQSLLSWVREKERNEVTPQRNVVYVAASPDIKLEANFVRTWTTLKVKGDMGRTGASSKWTDVPLPDTQHVLEYLKAFYHGMNVKMLPAGQLRFTEWDDADPQPSEAEAKSNIPKYVGLATSTETVGVRTRPSRDAVFKGRLKDDLLDTAISVLPDDAYALLMLVEHDLFEDEDDDFCCGMIIALNPKLSHNAGILHQRNHADSETYRASLWRQQSSSRLHGQIQSKPGRHPRCREGACLACISLRCIHATMLRSAL